MAKGSVKSCPFGKDRHEQKAAAVKASPVARAERCGRCRGWHPVEDRKGRHR